MEQDPSMYRRIKVGSAMPSEQSAEIKHETEDGKYIWLSGFGSENVDGREATMHVYDPKTGEAEVRQGRVVGAIRETGSYLWKHKAAIGTMVVSVALGTLWVHHKRR